jgi:hypothetical protein
MERSKTKKAASIRDAVRQVWKRRQLTVRKKTKRDDPDKMPSSGTQPLGRGDDAASQGRQDNDFETPQATQISGVVSFSELMAMRRCRHLRRGDAETLLVILEPPFK